MFETATATTVTIDQGDSDRYLRRFESEFRKIMDEVSIYTEIIPQYKSENESLRERLDNIKGWVEAASKIRYMPGTDADAVLANLITNVLPECTDLQDLKPMIQDQPDIKSASDELFQMLVQSRGVAIDEAFQGFDFYEDNPYKRTAERRIAKYKRKY